MSLHRKSGEAADDPSQAHQRRAARRRHGSGSTRCPTPSTPPARSCPRCPPGAAGAAPPRSRSGRPSATPRLARRRSPDRRRRHRPHRRGRARPRHRARRRAAEAARDLDLPPWLKGRYGTAVGRAVHGTLQTIDLATGAGLDAAVAAQCEAEAIPDRADHVRRLVRHALADRRPGGGRPPHWREVYACTPVDGRLLEGYIDLLYGSPTGSSSSTTRRPTADPGELARRAAGYRLQGASYALTIAATTGEPVQRVTFLYLTPDGRSSATWPTSTPPSTACGRS